MGTRHAFFALAGLTVGLLAASRLPLHAQKPPAEAAPPAPVGMAAPPSSEGKPSIQEALLRPYAFDFERPTTLEQVARRLSTDLGGEVVLDVAALDRLDLRKDDTIELSLKSARLKTGLKLLLDQVDLTFRLAPEDNLLILTDLDGSEDPLDRIRAELSDMHREIHDIQDAVEELLDRAESRDELPFRQPTIIEELPVVPGIDPTVPESSPVPDDEEPEPTPPRRPRTSL